MSNICDKFAFPLLTDMVSMFWSVDTCIVIVASWGDCSGVVSLFQGSLFLISAGLYLMRREEFLGFLVVCLALSWVNLLYFSRGDKHMGIYSIMIQKVWPVRLRDGQHFSRQQHLVFSRWFSVTSCAFSLCTLSSCLDFQQVLYASEVFIKRGYWVNISLLSSFRHSCPQSNINISCVLFSDHSGGHPPYWASCEEYHQYGERTSLWSPQQWWGLCQTHLQEHLVHHTTALQVHHRNGRHGVHRPLQVQGGLLRAPHRLYHPHLHPAAQHAHRPYEPHGGEDHHGERQHLAASGDASHRRSVTVSSLREVWCWWYYVDSRGPSPLWTWSGGFPGVWGDGFAAGWRKT